MKNRIAFTLTALGLFVLGLVVYMPKPGPAHETGIDQTPTVLAPRHGPAPSNPSRNSGMMPSATGDLVGTVTFSQNCGSGLGVGVTYDGAGHLWVSCYASSPDLLRASATTGVVDQTYNIKGGLGALAYDATRNAIWAGPGCAGDGNVWLIQLDATKSVTGSSSQFTPTAGAVSCLDDGIGFDASDDSIYYSADGSTVIGHYTSSGVLLGSFTWHGTGCYNSGLAIGGSLLFEGSDGCSHVWVVNKTTFAPAFDFGTVVPGDPNFRDEGLSCDTETFAGIGKEVMWSKEAFSPNRAAAFEIPPGTCGVGGGATPTPTPTSSPPPTATPTPTAACQQSTSISGNFNNFQIHSGNYLWFSSVLKAQNLPANATVTITFTNQTITIPGIGSVPVPNATVKFIPGAPSATTAFNAVTGWTTTVPSNIKGNTFLSGLNFLVPSNLPGSLHPVTWSGTISIDTPGVSINWQWAAANYPTFSADPSLLGVKPVDDATLSIYHNKDHAGTPENFKQFVVGGGTGGGAANYTGSLSATKSVCR